MEISEVKSGFALHVEISEEKGQSVRQEILGLRIQKVRSIVVAEDFLSRFLSTHPSYWHALP